MCWLNGQIMPTQQASVSVLDHGVLYGDGVFEGIRYYKRRPFRLQAHLKRLFDSAQAINLRIPYDLAALETAIEGLIAAQPLDDGYLRLVVTRGPGPLGVDVRGCDSPNVFIIASGLRMVPPDVVTEGLNLIIAATRRLSPDGLDPRIKSLNYLNHILARQEANYADADEAILLNREGKVTEGTVDNVFIVRDGELRTPPVTDGALDGITRGVVMELAQQMGIPVREVSMTAYDLYTADECFLTGTGAELLPVKQIDGRQMASCPGEVFQCLNDGFHALVRKT